MRWSLFGRIVSTVLLVTVLSGVGATAEKQGANTTGPGSGSFVSPPWFAIWAEQQGSHLLPPALPTIGEYYNFAQVRAHQFVETWSSLNQGLGVHVRAHIANEGGGLTSKGGCFSPVVTLTFIDRRQGKARAQATLFYVQAGAGDSWRESNLPLIQPAIWSASSKIVASASDPQRCGPPPREPTVTIYNGPF